ncbi:MAG: hypothetical protein JRH20_25370 [Deltaproteobacteria bacterium]|nr:hypothetical protein [Deltaproteobacteria bacterium]
MLVAAHGDLEVGSEWTPAFGLPTQHHSWSKRSKPVLNILFATMARASCSVMGARNRLVFAQKILYVCAMALRRVIVQSLHCVMNSCIYALHSA